MKDRGIDILDFNEKMIDYISGDEGGLLNGVMSRKAEEKWETLDLRMLNDRGEDLGEGNRIIGEDNKGIYGEFMMCDVVDKFDGRSDVESNGW